MTDNQQKSLAVVILLFVPFILVHLWPSSHLVRIGTLLLIFTALPLGLFLLAITTKQTVKLRGYSDPVVEQRISYALRGFGALVGLLLFVFLSLPSTPPLLISVQDAPPFSQFTRT